MYVQQSRLLLFLLLFCSRGGLQVLVELTFKEAVSTEYAIAALKKAAESTTLATFQIKSSSIITTRENNFIEPQKLPMERVQCQQVYKHFILSTSIVEQCNNEIVL